MATARRRDAWDHTANLLAMLYNAHRDPNKGSSLSPADFHPLRPRPEPMKLPLSVLREVFVPAAKPGKKGK